MSSTLSGSVTLYNASFEPLGRVSFQHAVKMLVRQVAVVHEAQGDRMIGPHPWPRAVRLVRYITTHWLYRPAGFSRQGVLVRDRRRCAYCGAPARTVDHLVPASRGGEWTWLNTVAACSACNGRKGNRTPAEAGMRLRVEPYVPSRAQLVALA